MMEKAKNISSEKWYNDAICLVMILTLCLCAGLSHYRNGIGFRDEGFLAYGAVRVLEGQIPNRDFVSYQPPLSFYTVAAMFHMFGTSLISLRILGFIIYIFIAMMVYILARHFAGIAISLTATIPVMIIGIPTFFFIPFAVWHGVCFSLITALFVIKSTNTGKKFWLFMAGISTALIMISRQDQSFYLTLSFCIYLIALKYSDPAGCSNKHLFQMAAYWFAGFFALLFPLFCFWFFADALPDMFNQLIKFPLTGYAKTSSVSMPVPDIDNTLSQNIIAGLFYLQPLIFSGIILTLPVLIHRKFYLNHPNFIFIFTFSVFFYCQVLTRSDLEHLIITMPPFFILLAWIMDNITKGLYNILITYFHNYNDYLLYKVSAIFVIITVGCIGIYIFCHTKTVILWMPESPVKELSLERGGVRLHSSKASAIESLCNQIQRSVREDQSILCLPYIPMFYFLTERRNPTRWNYLWPGDQTQEDHRTLIEQARKDPPAVILIAEKNEMKKYAPLIFDYIEKEYVIAAESPELTLYIPLQKK